MRHPLTMPAALAPGLAPPAGTAPLLLHVFPTFALGGAQVRFAALANRWGARFRHAVVALDGRTDCAARLDPVVPFALLPSPIGPGEGPGRFRRIRAFLRDLAPAVLVTSNWGAIEWAAANLVPPRIRHIHTEDGFGPDEAAGQKPRRVLFRRLVLRWSTVVLPSQTLYALARDSWRLPERRLRHIPNGLDLTRFHPDGPRLPLAPPGEGPVVGTVARLRPEKNIARLLRACALLQRDGLAFRLVVVGDGPEEAALKGLAADLGIGGIVRFVGHLPDPSAAYRGFDLFALSSDTEQMPFSVMEAMASGLPVAATAVGDVAAMLGEAGRPFLAPKDDRALAAALRPLILDAPLRHRVGAAMRARAEAEFDEAVMADRYAALFAA